MEPSLVMTTNLWMEISKGSRLGGFEEVWVGNCDSEVLG